MVWLISILTVSNIAMGYGLAIYLNRHYGMLVPTRRKMTSPTTAPTAVAEMPTVSSAVVNEMIEAEIDEAEEPESVEIGGASSPALDEEIGAAPAVDEENVLAGIEEFRSQLAKMNSAASEPEIGTEAEELESELVGAAN
jgi:hypothetical protein